MTGLPTEVFSGQGLASGVAVGRAVCLTVREVEVYRFPLTAAEIEPEIERFREATRQAREEIERIRVKVDAELGTELGAVFEAHSLFLSDPVFLERVTSTIAADQVNAEWAVRQVSDEMGERFLALEDQYFRERHDDLRDVVHQLLRCLQGISHHQMSELGEEVILVADRLRPSDAIRLAREGVVGFVLESCGPTSHTAIVARSLNLPTVAGLPGIHQHATDEDPVVLDGATGTVILHPTKEILAEYDRYRREYDEREIALAGTRTLKARTPDGIDVRLMANIELPEELDEIDRFGARGIGLYRSEFLYIEKSPEKPTEEEHYRMYRELVERSAPEPTVIRTFDFGGSKLPGGWEVAEVEENPALGLRGVRLTLAQPEAFRAQIRGALRAAAHGDLQIMVPLVSSLDEVRAFRRLVAGLAEELEEEGVEHRADVPVGIMIEVPSAALTADLLAREVDFFSVGTNDLAQYSLAVDRNNDLVSQLFQPLHPALVRMLRFVAESAQEAGIEVTVCGEMASDPVITPLLIGLGFTQLSMAPRQVPAVKEVVRRTDTAAAAQLADRCARLITPEDVCNELRGIPNR